MTKTISKTVRLLITTALFAVLLGLSVTPSHKANVTDDDRKSNQSIVLNFGVMTALAAPPTPAEVEAMKTAAANAQAGAAAAGTEAANSNFGSASTAVENTPSPSGTSTTANASSPSGTTTAEADKKEPEKKADPTKILESVANASLYVVRIFNPLIHFITFKIGPFLGNDYIFAGNMGEMLHRIWIINRNIVNIVFVLVLLYLALKFIINGDESGIAKNIGKFAIMLVAINFSWLAGRLVLDAANVATNVVFAIPAGISGVGGQTFDEILKEKKNACVVNPNSRGFTGFCTPVDGKVFLTLDAERTQYLKDATCTPQLIGQFEKGYDKAYPPDLKPDPEQKEYAKTNTICWKQMELKDYQQNNASYYLSYSMAKVQNLVKNDQTDLVNTAVGTLFSLALQVAYLAAFLSLFIVLIIRAAMMWILMAFSPYIVLLMYLKQIGIGVSLGKADSLLSIQGFVKWAFAPAKVGAVWTIGFIMITAGQTMDTSSFEKIGGHIYGAGTLFMGMDTVQQFIWFMMSLGIIWVGTFSMFADLEVAGGITNAIKGGVEKYGMMGAKGVGSRLPVFPVFDDKGKAHGGTWGEFTKGTPLANIGGGSEKGAISQDVDKGKVKNIISKSSDTKNYDEIRDELKKMNITEETIKNESMKNSIKNDVRFGDTQGERDNFLKIAVEVIGTPPGSAVAPKPVDSVPAPVTPGGAVPPGSAPVEPK